MAAKRKICIITGTRAEYGLLYWLTKEAGADSERQLQIVITRMGLSPEFGLTYRPCQTAVGPSHNPRHAPAFSQRRKRIYTALQAPNS
jgi:hypothetical protein